MKRAVTLIIFLYGMSGSSFAAFEEMQTDARMFALAGVWSSGQDGPDADLSHPAMLCQGVKWKWIAGSSLPFRLTDLSAFSSAGYFNYASLGLGLGLNTLGSDLYRETNFKMAASGQYGQMISAGLGLNLYHLAIQNYGSAATWGLDFGLTARPVRSLSFGTTIVNLNRPRIGQVHQEISQRMAIGLEYQPVAQTVSALSLHLEKGWPTQLRVGQEFWLLPNFALRIGYSRRPGAVSGGCGFRFWDYTLNYAVRTHPALGLSHCLSLAYTKSAERDKTAEERLAKIGEKKERLSLNAATREELTKLPGIGERTASAIIALRDSLGGLEYLDDLLAVKGITRRLLERIAPFVELGFRSPSKETVFPININTAGMEDLCRLPGIGPKTAGDIIHHRQQHGGFKTVEDLLMVKGIGRKTLERIRDLITVDHPGPEE